MIAVRTESFGSTVTGSGVMHHDMGASSGSPAASTRTSRSRSVKMPASRTPRVTSRQPTWPVRIASTAAATASAASMASGGVGWSRATLSHLRFRDNSSG